MLGYVAQLAPPPKGFTRTEMASGSKALGFAPMSLNTGAVFTLDKWGGVKLIQPRLYALACRLRACTKTLSGYESQHRELVALAVEGTPLGRSQNAVTGELAIPGGWTQPAFFLHHSLSHRGAA